MANFLYNNIKIPDTIKQSRYEKLIVKTHRFFKGVQSLAEVRHSFIQI